jgi:urease alpha subunit
LRAQLCEWVADLEALKAKAERFRDVIQTQRRELRRVLGRSGAAAAGGRGETAMDLDCPLIGGLVVDGTGGRAYRADIGIRRGRIEALGDLGGAPAGERLDARARVICPGFIDMHSHSDLSLLLCPTGDSKIHQGVTTEVVGNCGFSPAPLAGGSAETVRTLHGFFGSFIHDLDWGWHLRRPSTSPPTLR